MVTLKNPYAGINPQLNSRLQTKGTPEQPSMWPPFHGLNIATILEGLNSQLPLNYRAVNEMSLQSRGEDPTDTVIISHPQPDITVFQQEPRGGVAVAEAPVITPTAQLTIEENIDPEDLMQAIVVRKLTGQSTFGEPVLRIELLSPSNKRDGSHYLAYRARRLEALQSSIPLVEIDYLHESLSPVMGWPNYPDVEGSTPYYIAIHDNRMGWDKGITSVYGWRVNQKIPQLTLPLDGENVLLFDFDPPYQQTYERGRWGQIAAIDEKPLRLESYAREDQKAINKDFSEADKTQDQPSE